MAEKPGSALMFDAEDVRRAKGFIPRLIRAIMYRLQITNDDFKQRYWRTFQTRHPDKDRKEFSQQHTTNRRFIVNRGSITFNLASQTLDYLGLDIEDVSFTVRDRDTNQRYVINANMAIDELDKLIEEEKPRGLTSL